MKNAAVAVVFNDTKTELLLVKRRDVPIWVLPGGGIDPHETPELAVLRETHEETGLECHIVRKIAEYFPLNRLAQPTHLYECKVIGGTLKLSPESQDVKFFPLQQLPQDFFIVHQDWLNDALLNQAKLIVKPISRVTYWNLFLYFCRHPWQVLRFLWTIFNH